jgi:hypothetical protein
MWQGGSPGAALTRANFQQLQDALIGGGLVTEQEFQRDIARLDDPYFTMPSPIMWTAWGRRPTAR